MRRHFSAIAVILTAATGCDNVVWGGSDVQLLPPPSRAEPVTGEVQVSEDAPAPRPEGPVLLAGLRDGPRATLTVVGEILGSSLEELPLPESSPEAAQRLKELLSPGSDWVLFSEGARVGRMTADESGIDPSFCGARATVSGVVELVPSAANAERLLALPADVARDRPYDEFTTYVHDYDQRVASLNLAGEALPRVGAVWPAGGMLQARSEIKAFQLADETSPFVAATFLYQDQLATTAPGQGAYSLFLMAAPGAGGFETAYLWYRAVATEGKGAPRFFDHLDWDGDGTAEVLLDVFGVDRRWYAALARRDGSWVRTFQSACGTGSQTTGG